MKERTDEHAPQTLPRDREQPSSGLLTGHNRNRETFPSVGFQQAEVVGQIGVGRVLEALPVLVFGDQQAGMPLTQRSEFSADDYWRQKQKNGDANQAKSSVTALAFTSSRGWLRWL